MKNNFKFFSIVLVLLLASSIVLTGCMYAIAAENGYAKVYNMGSQISADSNIIVDDDTPTSQSELQKKFSAMYDIGENGKTVTVISSDYLNNYWQSNYEKEVIHSLTTEEVYYIIQDSIRIYMEYDKVILTGFGPVSSTIQDAKRFPYVERREICRFEASTLDQIKADIYSIIIYRLQVLSSPESFFTGEDAILFVGGNPGIYSTMIAWTKFYIPDYSDNTDREYILSVVGKSVKKNDEHIDLDKFSDLFGFCNKNGASISFKSKINEQSIDIFPTDEINKLPVSDRLETDKGDATNNPNTDITDIPGLDETNTPYFKIDTTSGKCSLVSSNGSKVEAEGTYIQEGNVYILYFDGDYQYLFYYLEGVGYEYGKAESNPIPEFGFESSQVFSLYDNLLKPTDK